MALTKVTYAMIEGAQFNAQDYGVVGDGTTDDTTAFAAAVTAAANNTLYIPSGLTVYLTNQITISSPISIVMGASSSIKSGYSPVSNTDALLNITSDNVSLTNVSIDGQNNDHVGIEATGVSYITIDGGTIQRCGILSHITFTTCTDVSVTNVISLANKVNSGSTSHGAIYVNGGNRVNVENCTVTGFCGKGINIRATEKANVTNCFVYDLLTNVSDGIYFGYQTSYSTITDCEVSNVVGNGIKISRTASYNSVKGCSVYGTAYTGTNGIFLQGATFTKVSDCTVHRAGDEVSIKVQPHPDPEGGNSVSNVISNCSINTDATTASAIYMDDNAGASSYTNYNTQVTGCNIVGGKIGIETYCATTYISNNNIFGTQTYTISLRGIAHDSSVVDNTVYGSAGGSSIFVSFNSLQVNINVSRNRILSSDSTGVYLAYVGSSVISNNIIIGTNTAATNGILASTGCTEISVNGNYVENFPAGISISNAAAVGVIASNNQMKTISGNALYFNGVSGRFVGNFPDGGAVSLTASASVINLGNT